MRWILLIGGHEDPTVGDKRGTIHPACFRGGGFQDNLVDTKAFHNGCGGSVHNLGITGTFKRGAEIWPVCQCNLGSCHAHETNNTSKMMTVCAAIWRPSLPNIGVTEGAPRIHVGNLGTL